MYFASYFPLPPPPHPPTHLNAHQTATQIYCLDIEAHSPISDFSSHYKLKLAVIYGTALCCCSSVEAAEREHLSSVQSDPYRCQLRATQLRDPTVSSSSDEIEDWGTLSVPVHAQVCVCAHAHTCTLYTAH